MKTIENLDEFLRLDAEGLADSRFLCPFCGKEHTIPFKTIKVGENLVGTIPQLSSQILGRTPRHPVAVYDRAIEPFIEEMVLHPLEDTGMNVKRMPLGRKGFLLDSEDTEGDEAARQVDPITDILIGIGSGVINDLTKWIATRARLPFIIFGTAPSMNGYTSITATITEGGIKKSEVLLPADTILGDFNVMAKAPLPMIRAGMEDLTARAICNADWKLSNSLRNTYFCPLPFQMTSRTERTYLTSAADIGKAIPKGIRALVDAIMVSGLSMTILGDNTSPSSGGEHILSHFWDLLVHLRGVPKNLHGAQVGIGTVIMLALYEHIRQYDISRIDPPTLLRQRPSLEAIEAENRTLYGHYSVDFNTVARQKRIPDGEFTAYIKGILDRWDKMWEELDPYVSSLEAIKIPLMTAGVDLHLDSIQRTPQEGIEALLNGNRYRPRYTLLDLAWELGIFPQDAEQVLQRAGVL